MASIPPPINTPLDSDATNLITNRIWLEFLRRIGTLTVEGVRIIDPSDGQIKDLVATVTAQGIVIKFQEVPDVTVCLNDGGTPKVMTLRDDAIYWTAAIGATVTDIVLMDISTEPQMPKRMVLSADAIGWDIVTGEYTVTDLVKIDQATGTRKRMILNNDAIYWETV